MKDIPVGTVVFSQIIYLPDDAPILRFDFSRAMFVEKVTELNFTNGALVSASVNKPSELYGALDIPMKVIKGVFSAPTEILQLKIDYSNKNKELMAARQSELQAKQDLIEYMKAKANNQ